MSFRQVNCLESGTAIPKLVLILDHSDRWKHGISREADVTRYFSAYFMLSYCKSDKNDFFFFFFTTQSSSFLLVLFVCFPSHLQMLLLNVVSPPPLPHR